MAKTVGICDKMKVTGAVISVIVLILIHDAAAMAGEWVCQFWFSMFLLVAFGGFFLLLVVVFVVVIFCFGFFAGWSSTSKIMAEYYVHGIWD